MKVKEIGNLTTDPTYGEKDDLKYCNFNIAINCFSFPPLTLPCSVSSP